MPLPATVPMALTSEPFRGSDSVRAGLLTRRQLDSSVWLRLFRDVYIHRDVELTHLMRCRAIAHLMPAGAAVSGASAAHLLGADIAGANAPVEITVPRELRMPGHPGVVIRYSELRPDDVVPAHGIPTTSGVRTAFDLARRSGLDYGVVAVDALIQSSGITLDAIAAYAAAGRRRWHGGRRLARALALATPGAESPMETRLRLALVLAGLPMPVLQHCVQDRSGIVARLDLAYVEARLGIEYDGECHLDPDVVRRDLRRQNALRARGWTLLRFTADDVLRNTARMVAQVSAASGLPYLGHLKTVI